MGCKKTKQKQKQKKRNETNRKFGSHRMRRLASLIMGNRLSQKSCFHRNSKCCVRKAAQHTASPTPSQKGLSPASDCLAAIWNSLGGDPQALKRIDLLGSDPVLPSNFRVGTAAASTVGLAALAASEVGRLRGQSQGTKVSVDFLEAVAAFRSERYLLLNGKGYGSSWDHIAGLYQTRNGTWIRLHTNFPHHRQAVLAVLNCDNDRSSVSRAIARCNAEELETAIISAGGCAAVVRSRAEWKQHPQGEATAQLPVMEIDRICPPNSGNTESSTNTCIDTSTIEASPLLQRRLDCQRDDSELLLRPLCGLRVLDLTRVLAGPVCGRFLAGCGANVMRVAAPHLPSIEQCVVDTSAGKLSTFLDLREEHDRARFETLVKQADILLQAYRPDAIAGLGSV